MSRPDIGEKPEPHEDPPPDEAPGGPADRIDRDPDDFPIATPDQPQSAQVEDDQVPDEIEQPEEVDEEEQGDADLKVAQPYVVVVAPPDAPSAAPKRKSRGRGFGGDDGPGRSIV